MTALRLLHLNKKEAFHGLLSQYTIVSAMASWICRSVTGYQTTWLKALMV